MEQTIDSQDFAETPQSEPRMRRRASSLPLMFAAFAGFGFGFPGFGGGYSSYYVRHDPKREKTDEDLRKMAIAEAKRNRKAARRA